MTATINEILTASRVAVWRESVRRLQDRIADHGCLLFGAGNNGRRLAQALATMPDAPRVHGFISDIAAHQDREIAGLPVWSRTNALQIFGPSVPVVNCVFRADITNSIVIDGLRFSGFQCVVSLPAFNNAFSNALPYFCGYGSPEGLVAAASKIVQAHDLLADAASQRIFCELLDLRMSLDFSIPRTIEPNIYFPAFITRKICADNDGRIVFVDCGAYTGDTVEAFARWNANQPAHVFAIEPDTQSFHHLVAIAGRLGVGPITISCIHAAVGCKDGRIGFQSLGNEASHIAEAAETTIAMIAVDSVLRDAGFSSGYIKYDVEGFEREALDGAAHTISSSAAPLAVSVYHKPADLWEIPLLLHEMQPRYRFHLREHGPDGIDTVLYALPGDQAG